MIETAADGQTIAAFHEKPKQAVRLADAPDQKVWSEEERGILCIARTERPFRGKLWSD